MPAREPGVTASEPDPAGAPSFRIDPPRFLADPAIGAVMAALPRARVVGGAVRDALAGRDVADIDLATPDEPSAVVAALAAAGLKSAPTGLSHGTVTAIAHHRGFEVTTLRLDTDTDGRHATVRFTDDWRQDAARRDFTINAMSMTRDGAVFDYFGGREDLAAGRVRFVGDAATRVAEDYLRVLRYFRFEARYGRGTPDPDALDAVRAGVPGLTRLSAERVWSELKRILAAPAPDGSLALMRTLGVTSVVLPGLGAPYTPVDGLPPDPVLRLAAWRPIDPLALAARLKLAVAERQRLVDLLGPALPADAADDDLRRALADTPNEVLIGRAWLAGQSDAARARIATTARPVFPVQGRDLREAGLADGPEMGETLRRLRARWMEGGCVASRDELLAGLAIAP